MNGSYSRDWILTLHASTRSQLFSNLETVLRLGPQWNVKTFLMQGPVAEGRDFSVEVEYDRTETTASLSGTVRELDDGRRLRLVMAAPDHSLDLDVECSESPQGDRITIRISAEPPPSLEDLREYDLWARSILNYLEISESRFPHTRAWKWFLDRFWLRMTQSGKRLVFFIVVADGFSVVLLAAVLLWWKFFSGP